MARPVKRGPSPVLVVVLVLIVLAIGGGVAVWALRPQLPFGLPHVGLPTELPFELPWAEKTVEGNEAGNGDVGVDDTQPVEMSAGVGETAAGDVAVAGVVDETPGEGNLAAARVEDNPAVAPAQEGTEAPSDVVPAPVSSDAEATEVVAPDLPAEEPVSEQNFDAPPISSDGAITTPRL